MGILFPYPNFFLSAMIVCSLNNLNAYFLSFFPLKSKPNT